MVSYNTNRPVWPQKCKFNWNSELGRCGAGGGEGREKYVTQINISEGSPCRPSCIYQVTSLLYSIFT